MIRRPPRSTRTDTLFPYTTLFRSLPLPMPLLPSWGGSSVWQRAQSAMLARMALPPMNWRHGSIRSEEHTSELQSLMRISYAVFCLKNKKQKQKNKCYDHNTNTEYRLHHNVHTQTIQKMQSTT